MLHILITRESVIVFFFYIGEMCLDGVSSVNSFSNWEILS